jgi:hypothetical protein
MQASKCSKLNHQDKLKQANSEAYNSGSCLFNISTYAFPIYPFILCSCWDILQSLYIPLGTKVELANQ